MFNFPLSPFFDFESFMDGAFFIDDLGDYSPIKGNPEDQDFTMKLTFFDNAPVITNVIFSGPCTIVFWDDGDKTIVRCQEGETFNKELGLAMAIAKKTFGNNGEYYEVFKKWIPELHEHTTFYTENKEKKTKKASDNNNEKKIKNKKDTDFDKNLQEFAQTLLVDMENKIN